MSTDEVKDDNSTAADAVDALDGLDPQAQTTAMYEQYGRGGACVQNGFSIHAYTILE